MNKKQVLILWIIAALLGVSVAAVKLGQNKGADEVTALARGERLFGGIPLNEMTTIKVKDLEHNVTLRKSDKKWTVSERADFPVNMSMLIGLLDKLNEVKVGQGMAAGPSYDARFGMDHSAEEADDHGLLLVIEAPGNEPWTISLGKTTTGAANLLNPMAPPSGGGRYIRTSTDPESVYVVEETFPRLSANPKDWLAEDFLQVTSPKSISLRAPNDPGFEPWLLERENATADFTMESLGADEELINAAVSPLKNLLSYARFEDVLTPEDAQERRDASLARQATINTFDGFTYTIDVAPETVEPAEGEEPADNPNYLLSFTVTADLPAQRPAAEGESEEEKSKKDAEFTAQQEALQKKLAQEQSLEGRVFEVTKWTVDSLLKSRADIVGPKPEDDPVPEPVTPPGLEDAFGFPSGQ